MSQAEESIAIEDDTDTEAGVLRGDVFVSLDELMSRARHAATGLRSLGVEPGASVALLLRNDHEFFEAAFAASALGAATVPINWHGSAEEVAYVVDDSQAVVVVAHADLLHHVRHALPSSVTILGVTTPTSIAEHFDIDEEHATLPSDVTEWSTDIPHGDELDRAHASLRSLIVELGRLSEAGTRDPREVVGPFIEALLALRMAARNIGRFDEADLVRERLFEAGIEVRDTPSGSEWLIADRGDAGSGAAG